MNNIILNQLDLDLNSTTEEYYATAVHKVQTENSGDLDSDFNWEDFRDRSNAKQAGVIIGLIFGLIWPYIAWIFLKLAGYAVIGMTFGHGHEFVSSTFFRWTEKMGNGFYKMILQQGGVCWCQLFYIASMALGCFLGYTFTNLYVENYARFLQESNLTLAETQVKFQEIGDIDFILLIVVLVLFGIFGVVLLAFSCGLFSEEYCCDRLVLLVQNRQNNLNQQTPNEALYRVDSVFD